MNPGNDIFAEGAIDSALRQLQQSQPNRPGQSLGGAKLVGVGGTTDIPFQPNWRWAKITAVTISGGLAFYSWSPVKPNSSGGNQSGDETDSGTSSYQPAFELNGDQSTAVGSIVQMWEWYLDSAASGTGRNYGFFNSKFKQANVRVRSTTVGAHGYPGNIISGTDAVPIVWTDVTAGAADCWLQAINNHAVFLKNYQGVFVRTASDNLPIYDIWANEDNCRSEYDGSITTVQNYDGTKVQVQTHDTSGWLNWVNTTSTDDTQNIIPNQVFSPDRVLSTNPQIDHVLSTQVPDHGELLLGRIFG